MLILCIADVERDVVMKNLSRKEAMEILNGMKVKIEIPKAAVTQNKRNAALDMAINALNCSEIPNNSDTISRQAALDALKTDMASLDHIIKGMSAYDVRLDAYVSQRNQVYCDIDTISNLPTAQPERKTGRWIYGEDDGQDGWYCSECNGFVPWDYTYYGLDNIDFIDNFKVCPFCEADMISRTGADMRGEQDDSV